MFSFFISLVRDLMNVDECFTVSSFSRYQKYYIHDVFLSDIGKFEYQREQNDDFLWLLDE